MNINLLPKKSTFQKTFWPVMLSVIIIYTFIALLLVNAESNNGSSIEEQNEEIVKLQTEIISLTAIRQPDPLAEDFKDFQSDVIALREFRRDWIQILRQISTSLPISSRVLSFHVNASGVLEMDSQFSDLQQVAEYIAILGETTSIESVNATNIERIELSKDNTASSSGNIVGALGAISGLNAQKDNSTNYINADDFIANLEGRIKSSGLFTPEEIESAWEEVDQYKDQTTTPSEATLVEKRIFVYQTTLTIKMAPLDMGKEVLP